ncbi:MAG: hypothetical protein B6244_13215 [Candidatus Cloacimonetes bacterium 4572_55]|nr:MAG: hypothetical protein B6244_13215 [Candidatus Cloacimonetes bacterium 4572_55]
MTHIERVIRIGDVLFDTGLSDLKADADPILKSAYEIVRQYPYSRIRVEGHTDKRPIQTEKFPSNQELSQARARVVADYLIQLGIDNTRIDIQGFAATRPIYTGSDMSSKALQQNRRTEIRILPYNSEIDGKDGLPIVEYRIKIVNHGVNLPIILEDRMPTGLSILPGSATIDQRPFHDPQIDSSLYRWEIAPLPGGDQSIELRYEAQFDSLPETSRAYVNQAWVTVGDSTSQKVGTQLTFAYKAKKITLGDLFFDTGKAKLRLPEATADLILALDQINQYPDRSVRIQGHTDSRPIGTGEFPSNYELSASRARAVRDWLVENGISAERIATKGFAASRPVAPNDTPENLQKNRRVEIYLIPQDSAPDTAPFDLPAKTRLDFGELGTDIRDYQPLTGSVKPGDWVAIKGRAIHKNEDQGDDGRMIAWWFDLPEGLSYEAGSFSPAEKSVELTAENRLIVSWGAMEEETIDFQFKARIKESAVGSQLTVETRLFMKDRQTGKVMETEPKIITIRVQ